jgi:hypothetical protein
VAVDGAVVARKALGHFPSEKDVVAAVAKALGR